MRATAWRTAPPAIVFVLAVLRLVAGDPFEASTVASRHSEPEQARPLVSQAAREVLDGLEVGDVIAGLRVVRIGGPVNGEIVVELAGDEGGTRVWVTRRGARDFVPPERAEHFDLFFGPPPPHQTPVPDETSAAVMRALAARIDGGGAEPPADM